MVKGKFQEYLSTDKNSWTYSCVYCRAHLARHEDLISKSFQGNRGRAYLFHQVVNIDCSEAKQRLLLTGVHFVADVFCACCQTMIGWKYERALEPSQRYKEGKVILELVHLIKDNCWDSQWLQPQRSPSSTSPIPCTVSPSAADQFVLFECMHTVYPTVLKPNQSSSTNYESLKVHKLSPEPIRSMEISPDLDSGVGASSDSTQPVTPEQDANKPCCSSTASGGHMSEHPFRIDQSSFLVSDKPFSYFHNTFPRFRPINRPRPQLLESTEQLETIATPPLPSSPTSKTRRRKRPPVLRLRTSSSSPSRAHLLPLTSDDENDSNTFNLVGST